MTASEALWSGGRLRDTPSVHRRLEALIGTDAQLGAVTTLEFQRITNMGWFYEGRWEPTGAHVVVKLNVTELEAMWMPQVSTYTPGVVPHVYAVGDRLGPEPIRWLVLAWAPHLFDGTAKDCQQLMQAAAVFQQAATTIDLPTYPIDQAFFDDYLRLAIESDCPGPTIQVLDRLSADLDWTSRSGPPVRCHGDVHFGNAVSETPGGPLLLIDPIPRTAHWAWDAAYAELTSGGPRTPPLIPLLATARNQLGLPVTGDLDQIQDVLLAWSSMMWWAIFPSRRDDPWWAERVRQHIERLAHRPLDQL